MDEDKRKADEDSLDAHAPAQSPSAPREAYGYHSSSAIVADRPLKEYVSLFLRYKLLLVAALGAGLVYGAYIYKKAPRIYATSALINVGQYVPAVEGPMAEMLRSETSKSDYSRSLLPLLSSYTLANDVLHANPEITAYLDPGRQIPAVPAAISAGEDVPLLEGGSWSFVGRSINRYPVDLPLGLLDHYLSLVGSATVEQTSLIRISVEAQNPDIAAKVANVHAQSFIELVRRKRLLEVTTNLEFLKKRFDELVTESKRREEAVRTFAVEHAFDVESLDSPSNLNAAKFRSLVSALSEAVVERAESEGEHRQLRYSSNERAPRVRESMQASALKLGELQSEYELLKRQAPDSYIVNTLKRQIKTIEKSIRQDSEQEVKRSEIRMNAATQKEHLLRKEFDELKVADSKTATLRLQFAILEREARIAKETVDLSKRRYEDAALNAQNDQQNVTLVDPAIVPMGPISPKLRPNLLTGGFTGLLISIVLILLLDFRDDSITTASELQRVGKIAVLGVIPCFSAEARRIVERSELQRAPSTEDDSSGRRSETANVSVAEASESANLRDLTPRSSLSGRTDLIVASTAPPVAKQSRLKLPTIQTAVTNEARTSADSKTDCVGVSRPESDESLRELRTRLVTILIPLSREAEAFRSLRTAIKFSNRMRTPQIILITSARKGDGKTTVACNLASSLSLTSAHTLLIDADMRLPSVNRYVLGRTGNNGLSDVLSGKASIGDAVQSSGVPHLDILLAGSRTDTPAELLESKNMERLLEDLVGRYEHIIIDSPPVAHVSDPVLLSPLADGVVFVVRSGKTPESLVEHSLSRLRQANAKLIGSVLNDLRRVATFGEAEYYYIDDKSYSAKKDERQRT